MRLLVLLILFLCVPAACSASVRISEIAWMGTATDANDEWLELYNNGVAQDLSGWVLAAADGQPSTTLSGTIGAGEYFLLERTDDATLPDVTADFIYTGALGNDGETLELRDASGVVVDVVHGADGWSIGGDNTSKLTLQRSGSTWVTAAGTPKRANASDSASSEDSTVASTTPSQTSEGSSRGSGSSSSGARVGSQATLTKKAPHLSMELGSDVYAFAGVPLTLNVNVQDEQGPRVRTEVLWNFGDGATGTGQRVTHTYKYAGQYVVTAKASDSGSRKNLQAEDRLVVRVEELAVSITHADRYSVELTNEGVRDVDLSSFVLATGKRNFRFPEGTLLLAKGTARFPASGTGLAVHDSRSVGLFYPSGAPAAVDTRYASAVTPATTGKMTGRVLEDGRRNDSAFETVRAEYVLDEAVEREPIPGGAPLERGAALPVVAEASGSHSGTSLWWYLAGLGALVVVAGAGVVLVRREERDIAFAYDIIDMDDEVERGTVPSPSRPPGVVRKR